MKVTKLKQFEGKLRVYFARSLKLMGSDKERKQMELINRISLVVNELMDANKVQGKNYEFVMEKLFELPKKNG